MNCEYCGCLLPDEWHPNCKQCGGPRKAARDKIVKPRSTLTGRKISVPMYPGGFLVPTEYRAPLGIELDEDFEAVARERVARQAAEQEDAAWRGLEGFAPRKEGLSARIARHLRGGE